MSSNFPSDSELVRLQKPAQYIGGEYNSVLKSDSDIDVHFALAFPDTYEVGMSHLGIQLLYEIINSDNKSWAERVFMPLPEMETLLRDTSRTLVSLESKRPIKDFDILGFSLQYELCSTNILAMLDLSGIPLLSKDRTPSHPLVIGGGPYAYHPEAIAPFFDAFLLGDAEEAITEIIETVRNNKLDPEGSKSRDILLKKLAEIVGIYVPSHFEPENISDSPVLSSICVKNSIKSTVKRRVLSTLSGAPAVSKPLVPNIKTIHNRLTIEVMRGCVRGCRFCQAGYLYRPQRERNPKEILDLIENAMPESGFEEVSLLSLSTADYCSVVPLVTEVMNRYSGEDKLAVSFPSTRVDALTPELLEQVRRVRHTGFTIAPEAGTQRLRDVINKGVSDEQILETCNNVFTMGWTGIKLYFMIGLPTETNEDIVGIVDIAKKIKKLSSAKGKKITVSVSTHVPKPHTPFQWARQLTSKEVKQRHTLLANGLKQNGINFRYSDSFSSFLEGVFSRSDRKTSKVIMRAYELGCRLDAWSEHLDEKKWLQAFEDTGIDPNLYLAERSLEDILPWDHLSCEISKDYFLKEYKRSLRIKTTPDCLLTSCSVCGICDYDQVKNVLWPADATKKQLENNSVSSRVAKENVQAVSRIRIKYTKLKSLRFLGHLDMVNLLQRAIRRASLPIAYSQGFHPLARLVCGPPLQLGIASSAEFADLYFTKPMEPHIVKAFLNSTTPVDFEVLDAFAIDLRANSIQSSIAAQKYQVTSTDASSLPDLLLTQLSCSSATEISDKVTKMEITREVSAQLKPKSKSRKSRRPKNFLLGDFLTDFQLHEQSIEFSLQNNPERASPRPYEIVRAISGLDPDRFMLKKTHTVFATQDIEENVK